VEERGWFSSYGRSSEEIKKKGKEVDPHMGTVETLSVGSRGSGAGPGRESRDCIHRVVC